MQDNYIISVLFEYIIGSLSAYIAALSIYTSTNDAILFITTFIFPFLFLTLYTTYKIKIHN